MMSIILISSSLYSIFLPQQRMLRQTMVISWLLMPWLQTWSGHHQPKYWPNKIGRFSSSLRVNFDNLYHTRFTEWHQINSLAQGCSNPSADALELLQSWAKPSKYKTYLLIFQTTLHLEDKKFMSRDILPKPALWELNCHLRVVSNAIHSSGHIFKWVNSQLEDRSWIRGPSLSWGLTLT